jgi:hypothetical protein
VPGISRPGDRNASVWEWGLSMSRGTGRACCKAVADSFACYRWCWAQCNEERTDEFYLSEDVPGVKDDLLHPRPWERCECGQRNLAREGLIPLAAK